jgi:hypothetical protein
MNITYRQLIQRLPEDRLDDNISVYDAEDGEYYPVQEIETEPEDDVLDKGHVFLIIKK